MNKKWIIAIVAVVLIGAIFLVSRRVVRQAAEAQAPAPGDIVTVFIGDLSASATASGQVRPLRQTTLAATVPGRVTQVNVRVGDAVQAGDILMQLDTTNLALNVSSAEQNLRLKQASLAALQEPRQPAEVAAAEAAVASAQASLDGLLAGPSAAELALYNANVAASEASLASAAANLASASNTISQSQIQAAQAALAAAQLQQQAAQERNRDNANEQTHQALLQADQAVADAQAQLNTLLAGPDTTAAQGNVAAAAARLDASEANYTLRTNNVTAAQIAAAEAQLAQAQAQLTSLLAGATAPEITIAEAEVAQAQLSLQEAQETLAQATITAPFAGWITAVYVGAGEFASGQVLELVDNGRLEVVLEIDEVDVGALRLGQPATLTMETWPNVEIPGEITALAPSASTQPGSALVIYEVHLSLAETDLPLRVGMTANANLVTSETRNVLLAPSQAINANRESGIYTVNLLVGEEVETTPVTIGLRDNRYTEIKSGLQAGDQLLISNSAPVGNLFGPEN